MSRIRKKTNAELLADDCREAMEAGWGHDVCTYMELKRQGMLEGHKRVKWHQEVQRQADDMVTEKSWIGNPHGKNYGGRR